MHPEVQSGVRKAKEILDGHFHNDPKIEEVLRALIRSIEFLSSEICKHHPPKSPHGFLPGSDD
jgi:hypothetical protein